MTELSPKYESKRRTHFKFSLHKQVSLTLGSGSSRKPSATVTIIAIIAEISPAICICKEVNVSF